MTVCRFIVVQIDMAKHPRQIASPYHTGDGVLFPTSCDGYYASLADAKAVAEWLSDKNRDLRTHVAEVKITISEAAP